MSVNETAPTARLHTSHAADSQPGWRPWFVRLRATIIATAVLAFGLLGAAVVNAKELPVDAWNRVGAVAALALFYLFLIYRLGRGSKAALLRLHISIALGLFGVAVAVFLPGDFPWWMRAEQAVQLVLLLVAGYIIRRREVRAAFPGWTETGVARRRRERRERRARQAGSA